MGSRDRLISRQLGKFTHALAAGYRSTHLPLRWLYEAGMQMNAFLPQSVKGSFDLNLNPADLQQLPSRALSGDVGLLIGPNNWAGQAHRWAVAASSLPTVDAINIQFLHDSPLQYSADAKFRQEVNDRSILWSKRLEKWIDKNVSHVLIESARPFLGNQYGRDLQVQVESLRERGIKVGVLWHGTDVRSPRVHMDEEPFSYLRHLPRQELELREERARERRELVDRLELTEFVSTPGLLSYRPDAVWLPQLVDTKRWKRPLELGGASSEGPPLVVHIPSANLIKGTPWVDAAALNLEREGIIRYRSISGLNPSEMPAAIADADIVVDQILTANYGSASIEAMHMGKPTVAGMNRRVQDRIQSRFGREVPLVDANPDTIEDELRKLALDPKLRVDLGRRGTEFVDAVHQPEVAANILWEQFLCS